MTSVLQRLGQVGHPSEVPAGRHPRRWLVLAAVLVVALVATWLVCFSSVFGVRTVTISGEHRVSAAELGRVADVRPGTPLVRLDTAAITARIAALPAIRTVRVTTSYPSSVTIQVTERVAVGYRPDAEGAVLVDGSDVQFATVTHPPAGLPQLQVSGDSAVSAAAATVAAALPRSFAAAVARIAVPTTQTITLTLTDGRTVLWGGTDRSADKAKLVPVLVHQPGSYFDVSDPSSVISRGA